MARNNVSALCTQVVLLDPGSTLINDPHSNTHITLIMSDPPGPPDSDLTPSQRRTFGQGVWPDKKTVDIGRHGVTVSADPFGGIYQISAPIDDPRFALMIAAPWEQFDPAERQNPKYVRAYRKKMEEKLESKSHGAGLYLDFERGPVVIKHVNASMGSHVQYEYESRDHKMFVQAALEVRDDGTIVQASQITNISQKTLNVPISLVMTFAVSRASYGQLTDRGAVEMPEPANVYSVEEADGGKTKMFCIDNDSLGGRLVAYPVFYRGQEDKFYDVEDFFFEGFDGRDENPPNNLDRRQGDVGTQNLTVKAGETIRLGLLLRTEDIVWTDSGTKSPPSVPPWGMEEFSGEAMLPASLFAHEDGESDPHAIRARHRQTLNGTGSDGGPVLDTIESTILWENVNYIIGCCSIPLGRPYADAWAVIPDHAALPLGWPRDNYWQLRLLLKFHCSDNEALFPGRLDRALEVSQEIYCILRGHLRWLFETARIDAVVDGQTRHFWRRSYLINGRPKDGTVYQLDTQLYPYLQLCEYWQAYSSVADYRQFVVSMIQTRTFRAVLSDLLGRRWPGSALYRTDETPADDDAADYPYHMSSNVLAWHVLTQVADLLESAGQDGAVPGHTPATLRAAAEAVRSAVFDRLTCACPDGSGRRVFAYGLGGGGGSHRCYHDGNDMPTLFAREWGFLRRGGDDDDDDDAAAGWCRVWEDTLGWAFAADPNWPMRDGGGGGAGFNTGYQGTGAENFAALGSDHSSGPWVLGMYQEWRFAQIMGDRAREERVWAKIRGSMQWDGTFSEAVDVNTGKCTSKTWFSWPGAMIAENLIETVIQQADDLES